MSERNSRIFHYGLILLAAAAAACIIVHIAMVSRYNSTPHATVGLAEEEDTYADIHFRGGDTSSWLKRDMNLTGMIYDVTVKNNSSQTVSSWILTINITEDCYLNQFWNGEAEIHQHVADGAEKVQTLKLADYDEEEIELDYLINESDLMIPLEKGDYIVYHPSAEVNELKIDGGNQMVVGFILYDKAVISITDYVLEFYYQKSLFQGPMFLLSTLLIMLWILSLGVYLAMKAAYKQAEKEMELRRSGIACMAELYEAIYIINLRDDTMEVINAEPEDSMRPTELPASEQMENLVRVEIVPEYRKLIMDFVNLKTLGKRMTERNSLAVECIRIHTGWSRFRFIVMDRKEDKEPDKVLFTIQQINEEKKELDEIRNKIEKDQTENAEKKEYLDSFFREAQTPLRSILSYNNMILHSSQEEETLKYASDIKKLGETFLVLVDNSLEESALASGTLKLQPIEYSLSAMISEAQKIVQTTADEKNIEIKTDISRSVPDQLYGDGVKIKRIVTVLLSRVIGDMESGTVTIQVFGKHLEKDRVHLLVSVRGSGISSEAEQAESGTSLVSGVLALMDSSLKIVEMGKDRDYYFELEQLIETSEVQSTEAAQPEKAAEASRSQAPANAKEDKS